ARRRRPRPPGPRPRAQPRPRRPAHHRPRRAHPDRRARPQPVMRDAVVVGAGMGGLTAAYALDAAGLRPLVLEAGDRVGGLVQHARVGGIDVDAGAESFALRRPEVADLVARLGLADATPATASTIWTGDRALTTPARSLLGIPADPLADDVVAVVGPEAATR